MTGTYRSRQWIAKDDMNCYQLSIFYCGLLTNNMCIHKCFWCMDFAQSYLVMALVRTRVEKTYAWCALHIREKLMHSLAIQTLALHNNVKTLLNHNRDYTTWSQTNTTNLVKLCIRNMAVSNDTGACICTYLNNNRYFCVALRPLQNNMGRVI